jgi:hypothetical protein
MATFNEIKAVRLLIADPSNVINIISVATPADLPASPAKQTAYYVQSIGYYMRCDLSSGATSSDYYQIELNINDTLLGDLIDAYGSEIAVCKSYRWIIAQLGNKLLMIKNSTGAESAEYSKINDMLKYYKQVQKDCEDENRNLNNNSTGRFYRSKPPVIAGGNI